MTRIVVESGGEKWLRWAGRKLSQLEGLRIRIGLPTMVKHYIPESGVTVWLRSSKWGDIIRITAGGFDTRAYRADLNQSVRGDKYELFEGRLYVDSGAGDTESLTGLRAEWSKKPKAYVAWNNTDVNTVTLAREGVSTVVTDAKTYAPAHASRSFYRPAVGVLSLKGDYAVLDIQTAAPDELMLAAQWHPGTEDPPVPGYYEIFGVPLPSGLTGFTTTVLHGQRPYSINGVGVEWAWTDNFNTKTVHWRAWPNQVTGKEVLVEVMYVREATYVTGPVNYFPDYSQYVTGSDHWKREIWSFDLTSRSWTLKWSDALDVKFQDGTFLVEGPPFAYSWQPTPSNTPPEFPTWQVYFSPDGEAHLISYDNRDAPAPYPDEPFAPWSRFQHADVYLDGELWVSNVSVDDADGTNSNVSDPRGVTVRHLGTNRRGALTNSFNGDGREGTFWVHTDGEWTTAAVEDNVYSKSGDWMCRGTENRLFYKDGVQVYDSTPDGYEVMLTSFDKNGEFYAWHPSAQLPESYVVWTGIVDLPGPGSIPCNAAVGRGIYTQPDPTDPLGTKTGTWFLAGGVLSFTPLSSYPVGTVLVITGGSFVLSEPAILDRAIVRVKEDPPGVFAPELVREVPVGVDSLNPAAWSTDGAILPSDCIASK